MIQIYILDELGRISFAFKISITKLRTWITKKLYYNINFDEIFFIPNNIYCITKITVMFG